MRTIHDIVERLRAEYLEMPGLHLTADQVQRLCGIERTVCQSVLDALIQAKFLSEKSDGHYARLTEGQFRSPRPVKAELRADAFAHHAIPQSGVANPADRSNENQMMRVERRRGRSDAELRRQRERLERVWNEEHQTLARRQQRGAAQDNRPPMADAAREKTRKFAS
jgi:hypothetical protein